MEVCKIVLRITVEMTSIDPAMARQNRPTHRHVHETKERHGETPDQDDEYNQASSPRTSIHPAGKDRHHECSGARGGVEEAEYLGAAVIDVLGHGGKQSARKTKDHRVQIDEVDGLDDRVTANVGEAVCDGAKHLHSRVFAHGLHRSHEECREDEAEERDAVDEVARRKPTVATSTPAMPGPTTVAVLMMI